MVQLGPLTQTCFYHKIKDREVIWMAADCSVLVWICCLFPSFSSQCCYYFCCCCFVVWSSSFLTCFLGFLFLILAALPFISRIKLSLTFFFFYLFYFCFHGVSSFIYFLLNSTSVLPISPALLLTFLTFHRSEFISLLVLVGNASVCSPCLMNLYLRRNSSASFVVGFCGKAVNN